MTNAGARWLRNRVQDFRDRAEQVGDENTRARLLKAAFVYENEAEQIEAIDGPRNLLVAQIFQPGQ